MGVRLLLFIALVAIIILLITVRLALLSGQDRRRLARAVALLRRGMLPSKVEERMVAEGLDRVTAAEVVASALEALAQEGIAARRPAPRTATMGTAQPEDSTMALPDFVQPTHDPLPSTPHERGIALLYSAVIMWAHSRHSRRPSTKIPSTPMPTSAGPWLIDASATTEQRSPTNRRPRSLAAPRRPRGTAW